MQLDFVAVDVFTDQQFGGNPLAVVLNGHGGALVRDVDAAMNAHYTCK
jgi:predicted PhzF superfamily epimerase YddE/YHI9